MRTEDSPSLDDILGTAEGWRGSVFIALGRRRSENQQALTDSAPMNHAMIANTKTCNDSMRRLHKAV